jgi:protein tyrosine/serine phosphatase
MTNFRAVKMGGIADGILYRSEHPAYGGDENEDVVELAKAAGINCVINLNDRHSDLRAVADGSAWYAELIKRKSVLASGMNFDFGSIEFTRRLRKIILFMINHDGPYLIHCYAGVDRTGIVCAILEALMGASRVEIAGDYARSFINGGSSAVYSGNIADAGNAILLQLSEVFSAETLQTESLACFAERYLTNSVGLNPAQIAELKTRMEKKAEE